MKKLWNNITKNDVKKAIELFDKKDESYPKPRNTFLIYENKKYPAKHILGLAYFIANKKEIPKSEYNGGQETESFFKKLGFTVQYKKDTAKATEKNKVTPKQTEAQELIKQHVKHKIARLVVTEKYYNRENEPKFPKLEKLIKKFLAKEYQKSTYEFILTPGGFLRFDFPENVAVSEAKQGIALLQKEANKMINSFFKDKLDPAIFEKLKETADYFTIGIDGSSEYNDDHIEFVAVYDLSKEKVIQWTGKFYPTKEQENSLIKINNLDTHFIKLNRQRVLILGCHDLNVFHPRGQAVANPNGWRKQVADVFRAQCKEFKPDIILQHPHATDTPKTWSMAWQALEKELPDVKHFAAGIKYCHYDGDEPRASLDDVLAKTKKGDVIDFYD